jgi:DNA-binding GntR family transcriptional regulator
VSSGLGRYENKNKGLSVMSTEASVPGPVGLIPAADAEVVRIERPTLHNAVVSRLRDMITEGQLPPGVRIHEGQLGKQLGVSRTPLREALKVMASEGLVDLVPSRGALVRNLTPKDVRDMLTVLGALEELAGRLACANALDAGIAEIRRLHDEMLGFYRARDLLGYFKHNQQIHSSIIALAGNESLVLVQGMLQAQMKRIRFLGNRSDESWAGAVADHEEMIAALEARDGVRLGRALADHLSRTWDRVQHAL